MRIENYNSLAVLFIGLFFVHSNVSIANELEPVLVSKEPVVYQPSSKKTYNITRPNEMMVLCLEGCERRSQMIAMGIEEIMEHCQHQCSIEMAQIKIKSENPDTRIEGIRQLCEVADREVVGDLINLLEKDMIDRTGVWADIISALGRIGDKSAIPVLSELAVLPDEDWLGRVMAVNALNEIGSQLATETLINAAWNAETRNSAIVALANLKDPRAASTLVSAIQPDEEQFTRNSAAKGLVELGAYAVEPIYEEYMNFSQENKQTQKRVWLCEILGKINNEQSKEALKRSHNDFDPAVKSCSRKYQ